MKDPSKILIIPMESLTNDHQGVIDAVMDHVHAKRYKLNINESDSRHVNIGTADSYQYIQISNSTREKLRNKLKHDVLLLEQLVGKNFLGLRGQEKVTRLSMNLGLLLRLSLKLTSLLFELELSAFIVLVCRCIHFLCVL